MKRLTRNTGMQNAGAQGAPAPATFDEYTAGSAAGTLPATFDEYMAGRRQETQLPLTFDEYLAQAPMRQAQARQEERQKCMEASGFGQMQTDMQGLFDRMDSYFRTQHRAGSGAATYTQELGGMLKAVEQERDYFTRYADVLDEQEAMSLQNELNGWESRIKTYQEAMSGGGSDTGTLAMASGMLRLQEQAQALFSETQQEQKPGTVVPAEWTKRAQSLQKDAEEVEAFLQKNNSAAAQELLRQAQAYKNQLANLQSMGTGRTNPLTGKQMPLMPQAAAVYTDTDMDGKADSLTQGGLYGQKLAQKQALTLSEQADEKAKNADWENQTAKQHEEYIRKDFETLTNYAWRGRSQGAAENIDAQIIGQIAGRLYTLAHSGSCTEAEFEALVDSVEEMKKEYRQEADLAYRNYPTKWQGNAQGVIHDALKSIPDKADLMKEFRYQQENLTRENLPYKPVDELLVWMTLSWGKWGATEAEKQADAYFGKTVLPEYLANAEMTQEQYDRYLKEIEGLPQEAELRAAREANGLNGNREGQQAALERYKEIDAGTFGTMIQTGSENATENVMSKFPAGAEQVLVRGLGWIGRGVGRFLNMFGKNPVGDYFYEGGVKNSQYENEDWQEGKYREYKSGRATSDLLENGGKFEKWAAQTTMSLTQAAMEMAAAGAVAGQISAGSAALSQLSQGGKYASSLANTMKPASGYAKTVSQFAGLMKNSSNLLISAKAALDKYGEVEDSGGSMPERALALIAGGLIEYETNGLFGGNPIIDPEGAGAVAKYVYKMTENETIRKIISSKLFDRIGEGLEEVASAVAGAALDYAMTGETELSAQELVDEFTVGVLLSMVMSAPDDVIDLTARTKNYVKANVITKFDRQAQGSLEALYGQMQKYSAEYLCGDEELMRMNGWDEKTIRKKAEEWETIVQQFNTVADRLEKKGVEEQPFERYQRPENFTEEVDAEYLEDLMANEAAAAEDLTDRALKIRILSMRAFIDSVRDSTKAEDVIQAESAQLRLDILEQERRNRAAQGQEAAQTEEAKLAEPVEAMQEEPAEIEAGKIEGGFENEQYQGIGENAGGEARVDPEGQAGRVVTGETYGASYGGRTEDTRGNEKEDLQGQGINERVRRFKGIPLDKRMDELTEEGDPDVMVGVVPVRKYTRGMQQVQRKAKERGLKTTFVVGIMSVKDENGEFRNVDGLYDVDAKRIIVSVSSVYEPEMLAAHEMFHDMIEKGEIDVNTTMSEVFKGITPEEYEEFFDEYANIYRAAYENDNQALFEEMLADAYAGINRFGKKPFEKLISAMRTFTGEKQAGAESNEPADEVAQATRRTQESDGNKKTAREGGKMSFAGEKAKTASAKNLALAEAMEEDGASREEIWRKTGWIRGADKNWRFEIDDSGAEFRPEGDAGLIQEEGYRRLQELTDKWAESFDGGEDLTDAEEGEMEALEEKYSDRVWEKKYELQDFLKHDKLYEAYPLLRHTTLRFEKLDPGVKGKFDKRNGAIILSDSLFGKGPETLLHEIQHIIQKYEGFQGGTSPEYWARRDYESGDRLQERLQQEYDDILNGLTKEEQNDYIRYQEIDGELERLFYSEKPGDTEKYDRMDAEHDRLYEKLYPNEWFGKLLDLKRQMENHGEVYLGQYINSAGEIEARETASRRKLTEEERQNKMPDLGWDRALLTEDTGNAMDAVLDGRLTSDSTEQERYDLLKKDALRKQNEENEKYGKRNNITELHNLTEADLEAMYESPGIPVKSMLEDEDGAGDVSLVLRAKDADSDSANLLDMVAVVPDSTDGWLLDKLKMNGLRVVEYESGNEQARQEAEADAEKLLEPKKRFSLSPEEKVQRAERKMTAAQEKLEKEKTAAQERYRRELESSVRKLFNIQSYDKENLDNALEKTVLLTQQGVKLLQSERDELFETLMEMGTEVMPAEDYFSDIREELRGRKIYVPQYVREEFGDDWNSFRKRAFGRSKIYFTDNVRDRGADVLMMEMAENYPGTFTEEYDTAEMLRQIVDAAEKGQDQRVSMQEAIQENQNRFGLKEEEQLAYLREKFDEALNEYTEKAGRDARKAMEAEEEKRVQENLDSIVEEYDSRGTQKEKTGFREPWSITEQAAQERGFPFLKGRQVYPLTTWVRAEDMGNYGLVLDHGTRKGTLTVLFRNKESGKNAILEMKAEELTPVDGVYQPGAEETAALLASMPQAKLEDETDAEDLKEFYRWQDEQRGNALEKRIAAEREQAEEERKDSLVREEEERRKQEKLEGVRKATEEFLKEGKKTALPYGKGKPLRSTSTTMTPPEAVELLQAATGKVWEIRNLKNGTWKATQTNKNAPQSEITQEEAVKRIKAASRKALEATAQTVLTDGIAKEDFKGSDAMEKAGIKIDGSITEYGLTDALRKNGSARNGIAWQIQSEIRRLGATEKEVALAQAIAYGRKSFRDLTEKEHYRIVATLANLYMSERMQGEDLILQRKLAISRQNFFKAMEMLPSAQEIQENPELFHPEKLLVMNYRTAQRSMLSIFGPERGAEINAYYFDPVIRNTAENYRWQNEQFDKVRRFEGKDGKKSELTEAESSYVHMLLDLEGYVKQAESNARKNDILEAAKKVAEGKDTEETAQDYGFTKEQTDLMEKYALWLNGVKNARGIDKVKAENAAKVYRKLFDEYFEAVNDFLVSHGMQPIGRIEGYTPHIPLEEKFTLVGKALDKLGISEWLDRDQKTGTLPAEIAGQTEFFRPQKRWNPFFLSRKGDKTEYDIRKAFQSYVNYLGDVLYHTDDIQKLRGLESYLKAGTSGAVDAELEEVYQVASRRTLEEQIEWLQTKGRLDPERENFSEEEVAKALDKLIGDMIGEEKNKTRYSDFVVWLKNYTDILAGKQYGGDRGTEYHGGREFMNVGRRLVDTFARAKVAGNLTTVLNQSAQLSMLLSTRSKRAVMKASTDFISGKLGEFSKEIDFLTGKRGISYLVQGTGAKVMDVMFKPAELADRMLSTIAARAAYYDAIQNGMEHEEAIRYADRYGRSLMADRTKGAMPNAFQSKGFVKRMLNIFQIEALNSWEFVSQDLPAEIKQTAQTFGKKKAAMQLARTIVAYLLSAFFLNRLTDELYGGTPQPFDLLGLTANFFASGKGLSTNDYMRSLINRGVEKLGGEKLFDVPEEREEFDGGEAVRDTVYNLMNEIPFASNLSGLMGWGDRSLPMPNIADGLINLYKAISQDGAISQNAGEKLLELLLEIVPGGSQAKKTAYGIKAAIQGGKTKGYGENERLQYPLKDGWSKAKAILFGVNATEESDRFYAGDGYGLTAKQTQLWKEMKEEGVDGYVLYGLMMRMEDAKESVEVPEYKEDATAEETLKRQQAIEANRRAARAELAAQDGMTDGQKMRLYSEMVNSYNDEEISDLLDAGMKWKDISALLDKYGEMKAGKSTKEWAAEFANWLDGQRYSEKQREIIQEALLPEAADFYNAMSAAGVRADTALKVEKKARELAGENDLTQKYKAQAVIQSNLSDKEAYAALGAIYSGSTAEKFKAAQEEGIPAKAYAEFWTRAKELHADKDEEGESIRGSRKEKVIELIDSMNLTAEQKDWLVQQEYKSVNLWEMPWN